MDEDGLSIFDVESAVLTGTIIERQKDEEIGEWKYLVRGQTIDGSTITIVAKLSRICVDSRSLVRSKLVLKASRKKPCKVHYDEEVDALYLNLGNEEPDGVIGITEDVNIDTTDDGRLTGIEILKASSKMNLDTILSYTLDLDWNVLKKIA